MIDIGIVEGSGIPSMNFEVTARHQIHLSKAQLISFMLSPKSNVLGARHSVAEHFNHDTNTNIAIHDQ